MAWQLRAQMTEACSCNMFCPCWFAVKEYMVMDKGWCGGSLIFEIEEGRSDGVDLSGRTVTVLVHWPGPTLFDGHGTARVFIDDKARDEQVRELSAIFQGKKGGVMEVLAGLVSTWLPVESTSIRVSTDGDVVTANIGSAGRVSSKAIRGRAGKRLHGEGRRLCWCIRHGRGRACTHSRHQMVRPRHAARVRDQVGCERNGQDERLTQTPASLRTTCIACSSSR
jgi:hypothetical protein